MMNEYVKKMLTNLEPLIMDLDENKEKLNNQKERLERVSRFLAYVNGDVNLIGIYADQEFIQDNLDKIDSDKEAYKASCYLLKSSDESVKALPQYKEAEMYFLNLINYFKMNKSELMTEIEALEKICHEKEIEKKYYDIFESSMPLVDDVLEFREFIDKHVISDDDKINLLIYTINNNMKNYEVKE